MIDFLRQYWKVIALLVLVVLDVILIIVKKRPVKVVDAITTIISDILPKCINEAEAQYPTGGHGAEKLELVVSLCSQYLMSLCGLTSAEVEKYRQLIQLRVEAILETPHKKGD